VTSTDYVEVGVILLATAAFFGTAGLLLGALWRGWRALAPELAPAEDGLTHIASIANCRMCRDQPDGACTCEIECWHAWCRGGDCTTITTFTRRERRGLRKAVKR
jgi:hypothetical protein